MARDLSKAYAVLKDPESPMAMRLRAHEEILRFGAPGCGSEARQQLMAEALGDLCLCTADIMTALSQPGTG